MGLRGYRQEKREAKKKKQVTPQFDSSDWIEILTREGLKITTNGPTS